MIATKTSFLPPTSDWFDSLSWQVDERSIMKIGYLGPVVLALVLAGCTKSPSSRLYVTLEVDGKIVIDENAKDSKVDALSAKYHSLFDTLETTCQFAKFLNESVMTSKTLQSIGKSVSMQSAVDDGKLINQSLTALKMQEFHLPDRIVQCSSGRDQSLFAGCTVQLRSNGSPVQVQYALKARDYLQLQHGMKRNAIWKSVEELSDGKNHQSKIEAIVHVSADQISCTENLQQK